VADPLPEQELKPIIYQTLRALNYLDQSGWVHRDIKLENILLENEVGKPFIKLIDFGFDLNKDMELIENTNNIPECGTLIYMAPEVVQDGQRYSKKSKGCSSK